jgi:ribosomal protein L21E
LKDKAEGIVDGCTHPATHTHNDTASPLPPLKDKAEGGADGGTQIAHPAAYTHSGTSSPLSPLKDKAERKADGGTHPPTYAHSGTACPLPPLTDKAEGRAEGGTKITHPFAYTHSATASPLTPLKDKAEGRVDGGTQITAYSIPKNAHVSCMNVPKNVMTKTSNDKAEERLTDVMRPGDRVMITWDRYWKWNTTKTHMPKTHYEGSIGTVVCTTECFVWVRLDDNTEVVKKRKHNVMLVISHS